MEIQTVSIVGLGALGTLFGHHLAGRLPAGALRVVADAPRVERYRREGVYSNGQPCAFTYITPDVTVPPADLVLVAVKSTQLAEALPAIRSQLGPDTLLVSLLNGITSEQVLGEAFGAQRVVYCVAYGMDAVREGNRLTYGHMGKLCIGPADGGPIPEPVERVRRFFARTDLPHEVDPFMRKRMWGKLLLNVGVNQTVALYGPDYGAIQHPGEQRERMIAAMREVLRLSQAEGVGLTEEDLASWLAVLDNLNSRGKPSMRQDVEARRPSEVELFAGTVLALAAKHGLEAPVNRQLYDGIRALEAGY